MKKLYIENLGCAKNQVDGEVLAYRLREDFVLCEDPHDADLIIVNTCGFINSAKEESLNTFFSLKEMCPDTPVIVAGCLAQRYSEDLKNELSEASVIFGNRDLRLINEAARLALEGRRETIVPAYPDPDCEDDTRAHLYNYPGSAYLKISEGCNHRCGYCAIPLIRGSLRSRPMEKVLSEARRLADSGIKEINIVAQDLAAYGYEWDDRSHFVELLDNLCAIEGDFKVRMLYIHPDWMTDEIIDAVKRNPKVLAYFDIPFQHASASVLRPMRRSGDQDSYASLIEKIRREIPGSVIRTTLMLGFPGETKKDFDILCDFVRRCRFNWMGSFVYSLEEDTPAFEMTDEKTHEALSKKAKRWQKQLEAIQEQITSESLKSFVGKEFDVLIEELVEGEDLAIGRIYAQAPDVDGLTVVMGHDMVPGNVYRCGITRVNGVDLEGVRIV